MVSNPSDRPPIRRWMTLALVAPLFLAMLVPVAAAEQDRDRRGPEHPEKKEMRPGQGILVSLNGTATDRENRTFQFELRGEGKAQARNHEGNVTDLRGRLLLDVRLLDENGTVVKNGTLRARFHAHLTDEGWKWKIEAVGKKPRDLPRLGIRGEASPTDAAGVWDLSGKGKAVTRLPDEDHRTVLSLKVAGTAQRA